MLGARSNSQKRERDLLSVIRVIILRSLLFSTGGGGFSCRKLLGCWNINWAF